MKENKIIVTNLYGEVLLKNASRKEAYQYTFETEEYVRKNDSNTALRSTFANKKYIVFMEGDLDEFFRKLSNVILIVSADKKSILGAFNSIISANNSGVVKKMNRSTITSHIKSGKVIKKPNVYFLTGQSAVDILKELGYLNEVINLNNKKEEN